jgi:hypothetical protein
LKWPIGDGDDENSNHQQRYLFTSMEVLGRLKGPKWSDEKKNNLLLITIDDISRILFQETMTAIQHNIKEAILNNYPDRKHLLFLLKLDDRVLGNMDTDYNYQFTHCIYKLFLRIMGQYNFILVDSFSFISSVIDGAFNHMCESMLAYDIQMLPSIIEKKDVSHQELIDPHCIQQIQSLQITSPNAIVQIGMSQRLLSNDVDPF